MKTRESGMPEEQTWETFFQPALCGGSDSRNRLASSWIWAADTEHSRCPPDPINGGILARLLTRNRGGN
jgi:hypothetical protein